MSNEVKTKEKIDMDPKYIVKLTVTLLGTCLIVALLLGLVLTSLLISQPPPC